MSEVTRVDPARTESVSAAAVADARDPGSGHYVDATPFDPADIERLSEKQRRTMQASQWRIVWWRFRKHRLAVWSLVLLAVFYLAVPFAEPLSPYAPNMRHADYLYAPPQPVRILHDGALHVPFVYPIRAELDLEQLKWTYLTDYETPQTIRYFCRGDSYRFWGLFTADRHLVCPPESGTMFLGGTDRLGRDQLSGLIYGARISLTVGLVGVTISIALGMLFGGLAGYLGGIVDTLIMRLIEILRSLPELPLWMALSAALPVTWSPLWVYFGITIILGLLDWPGPCPRRALQASVAARGGLCEGSRADGGEPDPGHHAPPAARLLLAHHCLGDPLGAVDDPRRDGAVVPESRPATACDLVGRAAERGAEHHRGDDLSLADAAGGADHHRGAGVQLPRRRAARRGRSYKG